MTFKPLLTTTEAAALAAVGPSTIKRWADQGVLPAVRTAGGHRRFERSAVERVLQATPPQAEPLSEPIHAAQRWYAVLRRAQRHELDAHLLEARARLGSWSRAADEVSTGLCELGAAWERGELTIADEHVASHALVSALARVGDTLPSSLAGPRVPRVLLACAVDNDEHTLGLSLAELCVRELGAAPMWLGRRTPLSEVVREVGAGGVRVVALSASAACTEEAQLKQALREVDAACVAAGAALVLGGAGRWPAVTGTAGTQVRSFEEFRRVLLRALDTSPREPL